jgi:multiple sugar transport system ATP-binding protein
MRVRRTILTLLMAGLMLLLAGCGSGGGASDSGSEDVSLTIWADDKYSRAIKESAAKWGQENDVRVDIQTVEALGAQIVVHFEVDAPKVVTADTKLLEKDAHTDEVPHHEIGTRFVAAFAPRSRVRVGDTVEVVVDTERMHFFDPETGNAIRG